MIFRLIRYIIITLAMLPEASDSRPHPDTVMVSPTKVSPTSALVGRQIGLAYSKKIIDQ
jgi:hypothetical protein